MPAVQLRAGPYTVSSRSVKPRAPKYHLRRVALAHRAVADQPEVGGKQVGLLAARISPRCGEPDSSSPSKRARARPLARPGRARASSAASSAAIGALSSPAARASSRHSSSTGAPRRGQRHGARRSRGPRRVGSNGGVAHSSGVDRLAVVVRVETDGARRARRTDLRDDHRVAARHRHELRGEAARLDHLRDQLRVPLDIGLVARNVWHREQRDELVDNRALVLLAPQSRALSRRIGLCRRHGGKQEGTREAIGA